MEQNYFHLLNVSQSIHIDLEQLTKHYQSLASEHHPDSGGDAAYFDQINTAFQTLKTPSQRIKHLMDITGQSYDKRGSVSNHLINLFMSTGELLQKADAFIKQKNITSSILAKALMENQSLEIQDSISNQIDLIQTAQTDTLNGVAETAQDQYETAFRDLSFLEKWQAQLRERYAQLF